jgi:hypothetical protein
LIEYHAPDAQQDSAGYSHNGPFGSCACLETTIDFSDGRVLGNNTPGKLNKRPPEVALSSPGDATHAGMFDSELGHYLLIPFVDIHSLFGYIFLTSA